jgi:hypothetical protein
MGGPLVLVIAVVQLSTRHQFIATATAVTTSSRAVSATVFTASIVLRLLHASTSISLVTSAPLP